MEFDPNFTKDLSLHSSFSMEKPYKPQVDNGSFTESSSFNGSFQKISNFNQFSIGESSSNPSLGSKSHFYDPFDPSEGLLAIGCADQIQSNASIPLGSRGSNLFMHNCQNTRIPNYHPFFKALNGQPLNGQGFGSANPNLLTEISSLNEEGRHQTEVDPKKKRKSQSKGKRKGLGQSGVGKGQWRPEEDSLLIKLVKKFGEKKWSQVSQMLKGRVGKQCRERWYNHLRPDIKKYKMTEQEEIAFIKVHRQWGNRWASIARLMPGRTENALKNHFNASRRKLFSKRKGKPSTRLEEYIKTLPTEFINTESPESPTSDSIVQTIDAISDLELKAQTVPDYDPADTMQFLIDEKTYSEGYSLGPILDEIPNDFIKDKSDAPKFGIPMEINLENDAEFLECAGWNLAGY